MKQSLRDYLKIWILRDTKRPPIFSQNEWRLKTNCGTEIQYVRTYTQKVLTIKMVAVLESGVNIKIAWNTTDYKWDIEIGT